MNHSSQLWLSAFRSSQSRAHRWHITYFRVYSDDHRLLKMLVTLVVMEGAQVGFLMDIMHDAYIMCKMPEKTFFLLYINMDLHCYNNHACYHIRT
ncbi:hypothetical protein H2248_001460 [Termitomyces sp. 'cryptogamus']|nr:hypothetical protein H2248_001460 [Termitomyces sp. 'cryptogamus']